MKQQQPVVVVKAEPHQLSPPSPASANSQVAIVPSTATRGAKRRRCVCTAGSFDFRYVF
jgi:hypothetical protein